jgi:hypothetical protein
MWLEPLLLLLRRVRPGLRGNFSDLPLLTEVSRVLSGAWHDSKANHRHSYREFSASSRPGEEKLLGTRVGTAPLRRATLSRFGAPGVGADRAADRQRWKAETVVSAG